MFTFDDALLCVDNGLLHVASKKGCFLIDLLFCSLQLIWLLLCCHSGLIPSHDHKCAVVLRSVDPLQHVLVSCVAHSQLQNT